MTTVDEDGSEMRRGDRRRGIGIRSVDLRRRRVWAPQRRGRAWAGPSRGPLSHPTPACLLSPGPCMSLPSPPRPQRQPMLSSPPPRLALSISTPMSPVAWTGRPPPAGDPGPQWRKCLFFASGCLGFPQTGSENRVPLGTAGRQVILATPRPVLFSSLADRNWHIWRNFDF